MTTYKPLLRKIRLGKTELANRIVFGSHPTNFARDNLFTARHLAYYQARARGGAGMIVLEEFLVHSSDLPYEKALFGYDPRIVEGCRRIADVIHRYRTVAVAQLNHSGLQSEGSTGMHELWAPSAVPDVISREVPKVMENRDIQAVVAGFAVAAEHAAAGGLDGVEVNAAQYSLIRQFLSPLTNRRTDQYGGGLHSRLLFCAEILRAVRTAIGPDRLLGLRLCGDEFAPWGGLTPDDTEEIARILAKSGLLDYIVVAVGSLYTLHLSPASSYTEPGLAVEAAARIKGAAAGLPVFAEGRLHRPEETAKLIKGGLVDGVYMNRALISDPELPVKLLNAKSRPLRGCLSCNQGCQVRHGMGRPLSCTVNPVAGLEYKDKPPAATVAVRPKEVLVIGGGPAGIEAARTAASRGHRVSLWEAGGALGGAMAANAGIAEVAAILQTWTEELAVCGVRVSTGKTARPGDIVNAGPEVLVLATGAATPPPAFPVKGCPCQSAREALVHTAYQGKTILFWDEIGDQVMGRTVEKLLEDNAIYYVTPQLFAGGKMAVSRELTPWNQRCLGKLGKVFTSTHVLGVVDGRAVVRNRFSGCEQTLDNIEVFVFNSWPKPADALYRSLLGQVHEIYRIGDCLAPRGIGAARRDGYQAGLSI